jgi:TonB family protein
MLAILMHVALQAAASAADASAPPSKPSPSIITAPDWLQRPNGEDFSLAYPPAAMREEVEGRATITCGVAASGLLVDCSVMSEDPPEYGFGAAALSMAFKFRMRPMTKDGIPVDGGIVRIPMRFVLPKDKASGPPPAEIIKAANKCYHAAAAELEREPASADAQATFFVVRMIVEMTLLARKLSPAEIDAHLLSLRTTSPSPPTAFEREVCQQVSSGQFLPAFSQMMSHFNPSPR